MEIKDINRIALGKDEVLWVTVNRDNMPLSLWSQRVDTIKESLQLYFLSNRIIITSDDINMQAIANKEEDNAPTSS